MAKKNFYSVNIINKVLELKYKQNMTQKEIRQETKVSINGIKMILKKYGIKYKEIHDIYDNLPSIEDLEASWSKLSVSSHNDSE